MVGYNKKDLEEMINSVHDAKIYYLTYANVNQGDEPRIVDGLLKTVDFLFGLLEEGYINDDVHTV